MAFVHQYSRQSKPTLQTISVAYGIAKLSCGRSGRQKIRTDQLRLTIDGEGAGSDDEVVSFLKRVAVPFDGRSRIMTTAQGIVRSKYKGNSHHRIKVRVGDNETTENGVRIPRVVDVDIASGCTIGHGEYPFVSICGFF